MTTVDLAAPFYSFTPDPAVMNQVAERLHRWEHFLPKEVLPDAGQLCTMIRAIFWAGLQKEEGRAVHPAITLVEPARMRLEPLHREQVRAEEFLTFAVSAEREASPTELAKLAPALRRGWRVAVRFDDGKLKIWGLATGLYPAMEVIGVAPGRVVVGATSRTDGLSKLAVFGERSTTFRQENIFGLLAPVLGPLGLFDPDRLHGILVLLQAAQAQGNGGTVLIVPTDAEAVWRRAVTDELTDFFPTFDSLVNPRSREEDSSLLARESTFRSVGHLTAVDGAVIIDGSLRVLAMRAFVKMGSSTIDLEHESCVFDNARGKVHPGGARHQSAARFVENVPGSVALVASHDGGISAIYKRRSHFIALRDIELMMP